MPEYPWHCGHIDVVTKWWWPFVARDYYSLLWPPVAAAALHTIAEVSEAAAEAIAGPMAVTNHG